MLTIAIDSSGEVCGLALGDRSAILAEYHFRHRMDLLRRIVPNMERMLCDCGKRARDIEGVVVSLGPGSFTGLRIGVTVAKTLAYVLERPIAGVGTLDAMARGAAGDALSAESATVCPMIFARANEVYYSVFDSAGRRRLTDIAVSPLEEALNTLETLGGRVRFLGSGARRNWGAISDRLGGSASLCDPWADFARGRRASGTRRGAARLRRL